MIFDHVSAKYIPMYIHLFNSNMQAIIQKWGNSQGIRIPKAFLDAMGMSENDTVELQRVDDGIIIKKLQTKKSLTLSDIFQGYDESEQQEEYDWGKPTGREVW